MSSKELTEWQILRTFQPYGEERLDWLFASLSCLIANCHRDPKRSAFKVEEFLIFREDGELDPEEVNKKIASVFGITLE